MRKSARKIRFTEPRTMAGYHVFIIALGWLAALAATTTLFTLLARALGLGA